MPANEYRQITYVTVVYMKKESWWLVNHLFNIPVMWLLKETLFYLLSYRQETAFRPQELTILCVSCLPACFLSQSCIVMGLLNRYISEKTEQHSKTSQNHAAWEGIEGTEEFFFNPGDETGRITISK